MAFLLSNLLYLFTVTSIIAPPLGEDSIVLRPSYGAIFEKIGKIDNTNSFWYHTIAIPIWRRRQFTNWNNNLCQNLPDPKTATRDRFDNHQLQLFKLCNTYPEIFEAYSQENNQLIDVLIVNEATLRDLLPPPIQDAPKGTRDWRGALPLVGRLSRSLFGTATLQDIDTVHQAIQKIEDLVHDSTDAVVQLQDTLHSYQVTTNRRIDQLRKAAQQNTWLLNDTVRQLIQWKKQIDHLTPTIRTAPNWCPSPSPPYLHAFRIMTNIRFVKLWSCLITIALSEPVYLSFNDFSKVMILTLFLANRWRILPSPCTLLLFLLYLPSLWVKHIELPLFPLRLSQ